MKVFKSKQDLWLIAIIYLSSLICFCASVYAVAEDFSTVNIIVAALTSIIGGIFPIWLIISLQYRIDKKMLNIICGPFKWHIELSTIKSVEPSTDMVSSPALSLDRLLIVYGNGKVVLVSPKDKEGFISALGINAR
ncbi:MAG: PH domain-containing protein [Glaciecola sp.]